MIIRNDKYILDLQGSLGTVYGDGKLLFKGFSGTAIKEYIRYVPEHQYKFRGVKEHKRKMELAKDLEQARLKARENKKWTG